VGGIFVKVTKMHKVLKVSKLPLKISDSHLQSVDPSKDVLRGMIKVARVVFLGLTWNDGGRRDIHVEIYDGCTRKGQNSQST
jgi:hypothetical protein